MYFLRDRDAGHAGPLGLFASTDVASLMKTIDPIHNRGVGLVIGPRSCHAVAAVHDGERARHAYGGVSYPIGTMTFSRSHP